MQAASETRVWDLFVRLFHWTLVAGFFTAYLVEDEILGLHVWAGYLVFSLVVLRIIWGFVGGEHARFSDFVRGPTETLGYMKRVLTGGGERYIGHNPAGAWMVVALLVTLLATTASGMLLFGGETGEGVPGAMAQALGVAGEAAHEGLEEVHEFFVNLTLFLVVLHVAGVLYESYHHKENLTRAMVTGRKRP